jgi:hypothetical protein
MATKYYGLQNMWKPEELTSVLQARMVPSILDDNRSFTSGNEFDPLLCHPNDKTKLCHGFIGREPRTTASPNEVSSCINNVMYSFYSPSPRSSTTPWKCMYTGTEPVTHIDGQLPYYHKVSLRCSCATHRGNEMILTVWHRDGCYHAAAYRPLPASESSTGECANVDDAVIVEERKWNVKTTKKTKKNKNSK